jgi:hypothetical protein
MDTLHEDLCTFMIVSRWILLRNFSHKCCRENQNTNFMFNNFFFSPENRSVYEMWENMVHPDRPQMTNIIRRMRIACFITKVTDTRSEYLILIAFPRQLLSVRASMLRLYAHCLSCYDRERMCLLCSKNSIFIYIYIYIFQISFNLKRVHFHAYSPRNTRLTTQQRLCIRKTLNIHVCSWVSEMKLYNRMIRSPVSTMFSTNYVPIDTKTFSGNDHENWVAKQ